MSYADVSAHVAQRTKEVRALCATLSSSDIPQETQRSIRGLIYVALFGMYERTVAMCIECAIDLGGKHNLTIGDLRPGIQAFALRADFESLRAVGADKLWSKMRDLLAKTRSSEVCTLGHVFPSDGSFMRPSQLNLIWDLFSLSGKPWPTDSTIGRIHELVDARNHVAHGTEGASERGARITNEEIVVRAGEVEALCLHIVAAFESCAFQANHFRVLPNNTMQPTGVPSDASG